MTTLAVIAAGVSLLAVAGQTFAGVQQAETEAEFAEAEGIAARETAAFEERQFRKRARVIQARGVAQAAAAGLDITGGSSLLFELENAREAEIEALGIRRTGEITEATKRFEAKIARRAKAGIILGGVAKGGTVLSQLIATPGATSTEARRNESNGTDRAR